MMSSCHSVSGAKAPFFAYGRHPKVPDKSATPMSFYQAPRYLPRKASVHADDLAGDKAGLFAEQEGDGLGHLDGAADATQRRVIAQRLFVFLIQVGVHVGVDDAGRHAVDAHAAGADLLGERSGQPVQGGLGGGILHLAAGPYAAPDAGDEHDGAVFPADHLRQRSLAKIDAAIDVHGGEPLPLIGRDVRVQALERGARAAHEPLHLAHDDSRLADGALYLNGIAHVAADGTGARVGLHLPGRLFILFIQKTAAQAPGGQIPHDRRADTPAAARNEYGLHGFSSL